MKSAYYGKKQIQLHPTVCFYKSDSQTVRHTVMQLNDNTERDHAVVEHLTQLALQDVEKQTKVTEVILWSDGCASQYKVNMKCFLA